jgi:hypothetical protein
MVHTFIGRPAITSVSFDAKNAADIIARADKLQADYNGNFDAVIHVSAYGRKVAGFDTKVKAHVRALYCKKNPIWEAV